MSQTIYVTDFDQLNTSQVYHFSTSGLNVPYPNNVYSSNTYIQVANITNFECSDTTPLDITQVKRVGFYYYSIYFMDENGSTLNSFNVRNHYAEFDFEWRLTFNQTNLTYDQMFHESITFETDNYGLIGSYSKIITDYAGLSIGVVASIISAIALLVLIFKRG